MTKRALGLLRQPRFRWLKQLAFFVRGILYVGNKYHCPCCGWSLRAFVDRESLLVTNSDGYCPRCNSKARHRRIWLYLQARTNLFSDRLAVMDVGTWWSFGRRLSGMPNLRFLGLDINPAAPYISIAGDISAAPIKSESLDAVLCIHVLEHVERDREAVHEIFRVVKPGGWALVSVPLLMNEITREDPSITSPEDRERLFGEKGHLRYYGTDFVERLEAAGFLIEFDAGHNPDEEIRARFGLRDDENLFYCKKKAAEPAMGG